MGVAKKEPLGKPKGVNFYHDASKVRYLNMLRGGKAKYNSDGKIIKEAAFQSSKTEIARIEPNRRWFGNTRVIGQQQLETLRSELSARVNDPYTVLLRHNKLPLSLLKEKQATFTSKTSFQSVFGHKATRKRPKLTITGLDELAKQAQEAKEVEIVVPERKLARELVFSKGQSRRIWGELHKVLDSADVIVHVLDARDPEGTRCQAIEAYIKNDAPHKHLIYLLNKSDLVPSWAAAKWTKIFNKRAPSLAFHASLSAPFGKGDLISLLRQFSRLHPEKKQISVGFVGYPNTGKSSIINTLKKQKVCTVAPIPGETKVWQYITLMKRVYLIDCPGIVQSNDQSEAEIVLKGVVRIENLATPQDYVENVLSRVQPQHLTKVYGIESYTGHLDFLEKLAFKSGRLNKGGQADISTCARIVLHDWLKGKLPYYVQPPEE